MPGPGVLHSGSADFESVDDLVEAVGELLQEVSGDSKDDAGIRAVCQRMYNTLRLYVTGSEGIGGEEVRGENLTAVHLYLNS
jgi:ATP-binding cassette subfamily F protein 3